MNIENRVTGWCGDEHFIYKGKTYQVKLFGTLKYIKNQECDWACDGKKFEQFDLPTIINNTAIHSVIDIVECLKIIYTYAQNHGYCDQCL